MRGWPAISPGPGRTAWAGSILEGVGTRSGGTGVRGLHGVFLSCHHSVGGRAGRGGSRGERDSGLRGMGVLPFGLSWQTTG